MSTDRLKRLEAEQAATAKKIAEERRRLHAKLGADISRVLGDEAAEEFAKALASAKKRDGREALIDRLDAAVRISKTKPSEAAAATTAGNGA